MSLLLRRILEKNLKNIATNLRSFHKKQQDKFRNPLHASLNKVNFFGTLGIAGVLVGSYVAVKNASKTYDDIDQSMEVPSYEKRPSLGPTFSPQIVRMVEEQQKDEHLREQYNFIKKVVSECASSVFYLELRDPYQKDLETGQPMITSNGSGFVISEDGWALTNAHVVLSKPQSLLTAVMRDGRTYEVRVEDADLNIDLALLKIDTNEKLPSLQFGEPGDASVGEWVVALGSPLSLSNSVTVGIISSIDRPAEDLGLKNYSMKYIQTDASITFGNSGGPLVNLDGHVIGVNNLRLTSGISFAIPVEYARKFLENTKYRMINMSNPNKLGKISFGLTTISITPDLLAELVRTNNVIPNDVTQGLLVWKIIPESPAYNGLEVGDIITDVNGVPINKPSDLYTSTSVAGSLEIGVVTKGKKKKIILDARKAV